MRVLLDNNVNYRFGQLLRGHEVIHAQDIAWENLKNGDLISAAEREGFDVLITGDKQMRYQQSLAGRKVSIIVLNSLFLKWDFIEPLAPQVNEALDRLEPGSFITVNTEKLPD